MFVMTRPRATMISILLSVFVFAVRDVVGCDFGTFGERCDRNCSLSCAIYPGKNVRICGKDTGRCLGGCFPGWHGDHCNLTCSSNCIDNICNKKNGHCTRGCAEKYQGDFCDKKIVPDDQCPPGQFGAACDHVCPPQCAVGSGQSVSICERDTGKCHGGCQSGWHGDHCNLTSVDNISRGNHTSNQGNRDEVSIPNKGEMPTTHVILITVFLNVIMVVIMVVIVVVIVRYVRKAVWCHHAEIKKNPQIREIKKNPQIWEIKKNPQIRAPNKERKNLLSGFNNEVKTETMTPEIEEGIFYVDDYNKDSTC